MRDTGTATEDDMVLAWVRGDYRSTQPWGQIMRSTLGDDERFVDTRARTDDTAQNRARKNALANARGYGAGRYLFEGFPDSLEWVRLALTHDDLGLLHYLNHSDWVALSRGSRLVRDGAANVDLVHVGHGVNEKIKGIEQALRDGETYPELIIVADDRHAPHILIEGHGRATAYHRVLSNEMLTLARPPRQGPAPARGTSR